MTETAYSVGVLRRALQGQRGVAANLRHAASISPDGKESMAAAAAQADADAQSCEDALALLLSDETKAG